MMIAPNDLQYRAMQAADLPDVVAIERATQSHPWTHGQFSDGLDSGYIATIVLHQNHIVGFCLLQPVLDEANLLLMAITPPLQGQGLGHALLEASLARLPAKCVMVFLEVRESNLAAIRLYEKSGFNRIGLRKHYYPVLRTNEREHAVLMALTLDNIFKPNG